MFLLWIHWTDFKTICLIPYVAAEINKMEVGTLPGSGEPMETLSSRLSPQIESDDSDTYGPALPPGLTTGKSVIKSWTLVIKCFPNDKIYAWLQYFAWLAWQSPVVHGCGTDPVVVVMVSSHVKSDIALPSSHCKNTGTNPEVNP